MLGKVVGSGVLDTPPSVQLSECRNIVEKHIAAINAHYAHVEIHKYVIMPNHIHMLIFVEDRYYVK